MIGIYKITNNINGKIYVGQSISIERRWREHKTEYLNPKNSAYNCALYQAIRKYNINNFSFEVLEQCSEEKLNEREVYWIDFYNSYRTGYNMTPGGEQFRLFNSENVFRFWNAGFTIKEIAKIINCSKTTVGNYLHSYNISTDDIHIRGNAYKAKPVLQYSLDGKFISKYPSIRRALRSLGIDGSDTANISKACRQELASAYGYLWKFENDTTPIEQLINNVRIKQHHKNHSVNQYDLNGNFIQTFKTIKDAANFINAKSLSSIVNACKGLSKTAGGYIWRYTEDITPIPISLQYDKPHKPHKQISTRKVNQYDLNGNFIQSFCSCSEAAKAVGLKSKTGIVMVCNGQRKTAKNYIWQYAIE